MPQGEWAYAVDEFCIKYGPGLWPFYRVTADPAKPRKAGIRVSPDTEFRAWGNEYVTLRPSFWDDDIIEATLRLYLGPQGLGHRVIDGKIQLDLRSGAAHVHQSVHERVREQARMKADRLLALVTAHRAAYERGAKIPVTAYDICESRRRSSSP